jgi:hypothetical protein
MSDDELRTALQKLAEPVSGSARPGVRDDVIGEVDRRRRRRWLGGGAAAACVAAIAVGATIVTGGPTGEDGSVIDNSQADLGWSRIADSPLSGRQGEVAVWTGAEMLVVGGSDQPVCPPMADCAGPTADERLSDGAAYDPEGDSWRPIADAPQSVTYAQAVWTGEVAIVLVPEIGPQTDGDVAQQAATLAYDPEANRWRRLDDPPEQFGILGPGTGEQPVLWQSEETARGADWLLDPESGSWSRLPDDPFPATYDRSYTWDGENFLFTAMLTPETDADPDAARTFQLAELDWASRTWTVLPETPVRFGEAAWFVTDGVLVNPTQDWYYEGLDHSGGIYDLRTGEWRDLPEPDEVSGDQTVCDLPKIGVGDTWIAGGYGGLVSVNPDTSIYVASCAPLHQPHVGVWAGDELIVYGGTDPSFKRNLTIGLRWTPPAPE